MKCGGVNQKVGWGLIGTLLIGCTSQAPDLHPVGGWVTFEGQPLAYGTILFQPERGPLATGAIGPDGVYMLQSGEFGEGAVAGKHAVSFLPPPKEFIVSAEELEQYAGPPPVKEQPFLPSRFLSPETSDLTVEVRADENTFDFDLP